MKKIHVIRPEVEYHIAKRGGWWLIPYFKVRVWVMLCRLREIHLTIGGKTVRTMKILVVPKFKRVDAM